MALVCEFSHTSAMPHSSAILQRTSAYRLWASAILVWLLVSALGAWAWGEQARRQAHAELSRQADASAALHASVLRAEMEKYRALAPAMATDPDVIATLRTGSKSQADKLNMRLEALSDRTRTSAIYAVSDKGMTLAASNWNTPVSFVGADYSFRPYFIRALQSGYAEFFALGTVSRKPGLFLAHRVVDSDGTVLGVTVVKVEFDALEAEWRAAGEPAYVVDPGGVVLITSQPEWRFHTLRPMDASMRELTLADQTLGKDALTPLPFTTPEGQNHALVSASVEGQQRNWVHAQTPTSSPGWTLHLLVPSRGTVEAAVSDARILAALFLTLAFGVAAVLVRRRQRLTAQQRASEQNRQELERRIEERTRDLSAVNTALNNQIEERVRAEASREAMRHELVQASKLAALGQIAAGVAHEINQPVAAIQTQAETASAWLERDQVTKAARALGRIGDLTARIGAITQELRSFARKSHPTVSTVSVNAAIDGALMLLGSRMRRAGVRLVRNTSIDAPADVTVLADRFRLEQVIVNLIQNALEALEDVPNPAITLSVSRAGNLVELAVADNGPGLSEQVREQLFTPFVTTKANGLGLGLVISRDIIAALDGELDLRPSDNGAHFVVTLRSA